MQLLAQYQIYSRNLHNLVPFPLLLQNRVAALALDSKVQQLRHTVFVSNQLNSLQMLSSDTTRQGSSSPPGNFQAGYQGEFPGCKVIMSRIHRRSGLQFFLQRTLKLSMDIQNVLRLMSHYSPAPQNSKPCIQHHLGMISLSTHNKPLRYGFIGPFFR